MAPHTHQVSHGSFNEPSLVAINTFFSAVAGGIVSLVLAVLVYGKMNPVMSENCVLAALVGITSCCNDVGPLSSLVIG